MKTRIISGTVLCLILVLIVVMNGIFPLFLNIVIALMTVIGTHEICRVFGMTDKLSVYLPSLAAAAAVPFALMLDWGLLLVYSVYTVLVFFAVLREYETLKFTDVIPVYAMTVLVPMALGMIVSIRDVDSDFGIFYSMVAILGTWIADAGAYFTGSFLGKHKLCPKISPKKTVEGFAGGIVVTIIATLLSGLLFNLLYHPENIGMHYAVLGVSGLCIGLISVVGDLTFSIIKREKGIKDYGNLIPGHGGILDRFDSVIFVTPFVYLMLRIFGI